MLLHITFSGLNLEGTDRLEGQRFPRGNRLRSHVGTRLGGTRHGENDLNTRSTCT